MNKSQIEPKDCRYGKRSRSRNRIVESSARWLINIAEQNRKERRHVPRESNIRRDNSRQNYYGFGVARIVMARITEDDEVFRHHTIKGK